MPQIVSPMTSVGWAVGFSVIVENPKCAMPFSFSFYKLALVSVPTFIQVSASSCIVNNILEIRRNPINLRGVKPVIGT